MVYRDPTPIDPSKDYTIEELAEFIREKMYGRDTREAMAKALEKAGGVAEWAREVAQQIIDGSFDEGALNTEIERKLNELEAQYAPELANVKSHIGIEEIHRPIYFDDSPSEEDYEDNDIILTPYKETRSGLVLLDEKNIGGVAGSGTDLLISPEFRGKIRRYELEVYGGVIRDATPTPIVVLVDGDTGENYRSTLIRWSTDSDPATTSQRPSTSYPYTAYIGRYLSQAKVTILPNNMENTDFVTWTSDSWPHEGGSLPGYVSRGGGRWSGDPITIRKFVLRTTNSNDEWTANSWARLWGVI